MQSNGLHYQVKFHPSATVGGRDLVSSDGQDVPETSRQISGLIESICERTVTFVLVKKPQKNSVSKESVTLFVTL